MIRRPPRSTLFPLHDALPISKTGMGKQDGDKALREAEQLAAMGKISEIIGKRAQQLSGEITVEVSSGKQGDRKSTRLNSSHANISYAVFCLKKTNTFFYFRLL